MPVTAGWEVVEAASGRPVGLGPAPTPAAALARLAEPAWPLHLADSNGRVGLAAALGPEGGRLASLLDRMATAPWFARASLEPEPSEQAALERLATAMGGCDTGWLGSWRDAAERLRQLDGAAMARVLELRRAARAAALESGRVDELEGALRVCALVVTARTTPRRDRDEAVRLAASGAAVLWLSGMAAAAVAGLDPGPMEAAGDLLLAGRWPLGSDGATWWAL